MFRNGEFACENTSHKICHSLILFFNCVFFLQPQGLKQPGTTRMIIEVARITDTWMNFDCRGLKR